MLESQVAECSMGSFYVGNVFIIGNVPLMEEKSSWNSL